MRPASGSSANGNGVLWLEVSAKMLAVEVRSAHTILAEMF